MSKPHAINAEMLDTMITEIHDSMTNVHTTPTTIVAGIMQDSIDPDAYWAHPSDTPVEFSDLKAAVEDWRDAHPVETMDDIRGDINGSGTSAEAWEAEQVAPLHLVRTMLDGATGWAIQWYQGQARYEARVWWIRQNQNSTTYAASYTDKLATYTTWGSLDQCTEWLEGLSGRTVICK